MLEVYMLNCCLLEVSTGLEFAVAGYLAATLISSPLMCPVCRLLAETPCYCLFVFSTMFWSLTSCFLMSLGLLKMYVFGVVSAMELLADSSVALFLIWILFS